MEIGFNLPAFLIALVITAILVVGIKESARFNTGIVVLKVSVVLFVIALGAPATSIPAPLGLGLALLRAEWSSQELGAGAPAYIFSLPTLVSMRFRLLRRRPRIRSVTCLLA